MSEIFCVTNERNLRIGKKDYSETTVKAAVAIWESISKGGEIKPKVEPEPYIFKAGDVAKMQKGKGGIRIICSPSQWSAGGQETGQGSLFSIDEQGLRCATGQKRFNEFGYVKIGELADYLPKDE